MSPERRGVMAAATAGAGPASRTQTRLRAGTLRFRLNTPTVQSSAVRQGSPNLYLAACEAVAFRSAEERMFSRTTVALVFVMLAAPGCKSSKSDQSGEPAKAGESAKAGSAGDHAKPAGVDLEVTHWWTSGGEAAAVAELA